MKTMLLKAILPIAVVALVLGFAPHAAQAQVAQWNKVVVDEALEKAFYRAVREAAVDFINEMESNGVPAVITFVDSQLDYPLQLTTYNFRHVLLNAAQSKVAYLLQYQAKTSNGVTISIGGLPIGEIGEASQAGLATGRAYAGTSEIPGDGGMMLCPVNKDGLEFMFGGLAIATLDANGQFRQKEDGAAIQQLQDRILEATYKYYGHTPDK